MSRLKKREIELLENTMQNMVDKVDEFINNGDHLIMIGKIGGDIIKLKGKIVEEEIYITEI